MFSICPSECNENCPMSVIESISLGTPVICSDLGGVPELITKNTGEIFKAYDKNDLKKKILKLYSNTELLDKMSEECIKSSTNTVKKYSEAMIGIYQSLIENRG